MNSTYKFSASGRLAVLRNYQVRLTVMAIIIIAIFVILRRPATADLLMTLAIVVPMIAVTVFVKSRALVSRADAKSFELCDRGIRQTIGEAVTQIRWDEITTFDVDDSPGRVRDSRGPRLR